MFSVLSTTTNWQCSHQKPERLSDIPYSVFPLSVTQSRECATLGSCVVFHSVIRGGLGGMRKLLSARGHDRDLIRPWVCRDRGATVNPKKTDPSRPRGFTRFDPDTLCVSQKCTETQTGGGTHKGTRAQSRLVLYFIVGPASATPLEMAHTFLKH